MRIAFALTFLVVVALIPTALAQDTMLPAERLEYAFPAQKRFSAHAGRNVPTEIFWGDTHPHTGMSMDAGSFGARLTPETRGLAELVPDLPRKPVFKGFYIVNWCVSPIKGG